MPFLAIGQGFQHAASCPAAVGSFDWYAAAVLWRDGRVLWHPTLLDVALSKKQICRATLRQNADQQLPSSSADTSRVEIARVTSWNGKVRASPSRVGDGGSAEVFENDTAGAVGTLAPSLLLVYCYS